MTWTCTHVIHFRNLRGHLLSEDRVMLDKAEGIAYTKAEWDAWSSGSWELVDGEWRHQGQATPGGANGHVTVEEVP